MNSEEKKQITRKLLAIAGVGALTLLVIVGFEMIKNSTGKNLPKNFSKVYEKSSTLNKELTSLIKSVNENINDINNLDLEGKTKKTSRLVAETRKKNQKAQNKAKELSASLDKLTTLLERAPASKKKKQAAEALKVEVKLAKELQTYTQKIDEFLNTLDKAITKESFDKRVSVEKHLREVNEKQELINSLNSKFLAKVEQLGSENNN